MRKLINISALVFFIWLVLDTLNVPGILVNFLLVGELPGTNTTLSPSIMLAIMSTILGIVAFEFAARRIKIMWRLRQLVISTVSRRERLPGRRFQRI